tara:strand:+ start:43 stop:567 length:525 start_codon:yes stop_codon:yes gene_type:complete
MIITCNCGLKKFSLPDNSIPAAGRMVQCGSCGLKWKQFPVNEINNTEPISNIKNIASKPKQVQTKIQKIQKVKKSSIRKPREINLYSPEYLAKKHGIKLSNDEVKKTSSNKKISLGFYNSLLLFVVLIIFLSRGLYFSQDFVIQKLPFTEFYINYFFESIRNMFEIWKNLISSY